MKAGATGFSSSIHRREREHEHEHEQGTAQNRTSEPRLWGVLRGDSDPHARIGDDRHIVAFCAKGVY